MKVTYCEKDGNVLMSRCVQCQLRPSIKHCISLAVQWRKIMCIYNKYSLASSPTEVNRSSEVNNTNTNTNNNNNNNNNSSLEQPKSEPAGFH
jgi:hypothetical protein